MYSGFFRVLRPVLMVLALFLGARYLLPLISPFLLGLLIALAAEPLVDFLSRRCRMGRTLGAGIGVTMTLALLTLAALVLGALLVRELGRLSGILPELEATVRMGMDALSGWLLALTTRTPMGIQRLLTRTLTDLFSGGSALLDKAVDFLLRLASGFLSRVPGGALRIFTGVLSAFMISGKLEILRGKLRSGIPRERLRPVVDWLKNMREVFLGWLKAQCKLSAVTFLITLGGFFFLRIPYAPVWAAAVALVDALPVFGSGTVLLPWSLISFLQADVRRAFALLGIYGAAVVTRTVLEPRLVGKQLGLDPLATLVALYVGYRVFGLPGMLLSPMAAMAVTRGFPGTKEKKRDA